MSDSKTFREQWETLGTKETCPLRLTPFVGSRVLDEMKAERGDARTLLVELAPGATISSVLHLTEALESFFDLPLETIYLGRVPAKARRIEVMIHKAKES